ncbi:TIGR03089 family protein [Branchiibius cervicis]|uniref:TIGR03089 family protein n=1 Tax=Branchiibius cervicis TaxID=908252 RepID=A0ABW2AUG8_9MICO
MIPQLANLAADSARPRVTYYNDATGERIELSGSTVLRWVNKAGNWLQDEMDAAPGTTVRVDIPQDHWRAVYWILATWAVGAVLSDDPDADVRVAMDDPAADLSEPEASWLPRRSPANRMRSRRTSIRALTTWPSTWAVSRFPTPHCRRRQTTRRPGWWSAPTYRRRCSRRTRVTDRSSCCGTRIPANARPDWPPKGCRSPNRRCGADPPRPRWPAARPRAAGGV